MKQHIPLMIVIVFAVMLSVFAVTSHEEVHKQIYRLAGVDSEVTYGFPSYTEATNYTGQDLTNLELAHTQNEIVGYQIMPLLIIIIVLMMIQIVLNTEK